MTGWKEACAQEEPLLLDPATDDPAEHLSFDLNGRATPWSERGKATIEILRLNRKALIESRREAIRRAVRIASLTDADQIAVDLEKVVRANAEFAGAIRLFLRDVCQNLGRRLRPDYSEKGERIVKAVWETRALNPESLWEEAVKRVDSGDLGYAIRKRELPGLVASLESERFDLRRQPRIAKVTVENFKGIENLELNIDNDNADNAMAGCAMLLGENSTGKSSLLQAITLCLSGRQGVSGLAVDVEDLLSRERSDWRLIGDKASKVLLHFDDGEKTELEITEDGEFKFHGRKDKNMVLAYGARRYFKSKSGRHVGKHSARGLFDPAYVLRDSEGWLQACDTRTFNAVARALRSVMSLRGDDDVFHDGSGQVVVRAHGRVAPIDRMSDGYKALFCMAVDIMREMVEVHGNLEFARGIVLIDEIENHLHPRWKKRVMEALRDAMPQVQFIVTTHDPLCLRGMKKGEVHVLYRDEDGDVQLVEDLPDISMMRVEQILTSDYFGLATDAILSVTNPALDNHVRFLEALKRRAFGQPACVYIFTTNYDILFELAGARAGVAVETGFVGSVERFFDHQRFATTCGIVQNPGHFVEHPVLTVRLIKLHGSVSWLARNGGVFERHPSSIAASDKRIMILPRRKKVMDTLQSPHDVLFGVASRALGTDCKYLVSCGFSYGDDHINENLLLPAVRAGRIRLFALAEEETSGMASLKRAGAFGASFKDKGIESGVEHPEGSDRWMFSKFVELFC